MTFKELNIIEPVLMALNEKAYTIPISIEQQAILPALDNRDIIKLVQTPALTFCAQDEQVMLRDIQKLTGKKLVVSS